MITVAFRSSAAVDDKPDAKTKSPADKAQADKPKAKDSKPEPDADDRKRFQPFGYVTHEHEVTISGRALNEEGEPVAAARVFVVPVIPMGVAYGNRSVLAEGKTAADGRYRFEKVKLSVLEFAPQAVPRPSEAQFQVFAVADGYGYVWRHTQAYRPEKPPADSEAPARPADEKKPDAKPDADKPPKNDDRQHVSFAGEPILLDLEFSPEVRLHGTISDDLGNPLKNAVVQVGLVNSDRDPPGTPPRMWNGQYREDLPRGVDGPFNGFFVLPEEFRLARTDADGRYEIRGLPRDCSLLAYVDYLPEYEPWSERINTGKRALPQGRFVGYAGDLNQVFIAPVTVLLKVLGPARQPLANLVVRQESDRGVRRAGTLDRTDVRGEAILKLRPGKSLLIAEPTIGQPYLPQKVEFDFKDDPREHSIELELDPAAVVVFEAVEKETLKPIPGVAFLSEPTDGRERQPVQSQVSFVDHPRTDESGRLQAYFEPGERRFFVDQRRSPRDFEPVAPTTDAVELSSQKPTHLRFEFTRRPVAAPAGGEPAPVAAELKPLADLLHKQAERFEVSQRARFQLRHNNFLRAPLTQEQTAQLLDSFALKTVDECLEAIRRAFPDFTGLGTFEIVTDGTRRRVEFRYPTQDRTEVNVFNGEETIVSMGSGTQIDIYGRDNANIHFLAPRDFWGGPARPQLLAAPKQPAGEEESRRTVRHADGAWEIEVVTKQYTARWIIDESTGFERQMSFSSASQKSGRDTRQFFPTLLATGVAVPKLSIEAHYQGGKLSRCAITFIDRVELLERLPPEVFVVAAPPGTNIIDYRGIPRNELGGGRRAPSGVVSAAIPDVVAHRNRFAPAAEPVLKVGDESPELNVLTWLDAAGKAARPALGGKIVVIDFWGIGCGPCVAQLPEVNAAAKHFADSKIVVVGLHDSNGNLEGVAEFARKRGLVFPVAIDKPDPKAQNFGATFAAFGISGIPSCAVIDGTGRVAYLGQFQQAIEVAHQLTGGK